MSSAAIRVPDDLWDDDSAGVISTWLFDDGDEVSAGDVVAEVMNEKMSFEILAPASGRLSIFTPAESEIRLGQEIGSLEAA